MLRSVLKAASEQLSCSSSEVRWEEDEKKKKEERGKLGREPDRKREGWRQGQNTELENEGRRSGAHTERRKENKEEALLFSLMEEALASVRLAVSEKYIFREVAPSGE